MTAQSLTQVTRVKSFGGWIETYRHASAACKCDMTFAVFLPPQAAAGQVPILYWLSGLTCTHENFITKAGAQQFAAEHGLMLVVPDTSPRGAAVPGEDDDWDLGTGAGFYVNATRLPWAANYQMYDYVVTELPALIHANFPVLAARESIFGHSMGGHGALTIALKNPGRFRSISAFAPICAPTRSPWGEKAFSHYLGEQRDAWNEYDAEYLVRTGQTHLPTLIDQGSEDGFLTEQLNFDLFVDTCDAKGYPLIARLQPGYDHSYYFIATFMEEHIAYHAGHLHA